jgi:hypothetical protein
MKTRTRSIGLAALCVALAFLLVGSYLLADDRTSQAALMKEKFEELKPVTDVIYLLANSSIILGPDANGQSEEITFTGTVHVPKFPVKGFERRELPSGKQQIDFELTRSELQGESYLLNGSVTLGEHPDLPSHGTITQREAGKNYPADFIVQRKVLVETPNGVLYNEDPVPVRGTIDAIPPVRYDKTAPTINVFRGEQLPIAMLDEKGEVGGWFYSKAHLAFALDPAAIYRVNLAGEITVRAGGKEERVAVAGPAEFMEKTDGGTELIKVGLRGESKLFGGPIMLIEAFSEKDQFSSGQFGVEKEDVRGPVESAFDLYLQVRSPAGTLMVDRPIPVHGRVAAKTRTGEISLGRRNVPVYHVAIAENYSGSGEFQVLTEAEKQVATITSLTVGPAETTAKVAQGPQRRPCCPKRPAGE